MNLLELIGVFLIGLVAAGTVVVGVIAFLDGVDDTAKQAMCNEYRMDFEANSLCYRNSQGCLLSGADYRSQIRATEYLQENCPDEWKAVQVPPQGAGTEEANPGNGVGPDTQTRERRGSSLFPATEESVNEPVPHDEAAL